MKNLLFGLVLSLIPLGQAQANVFQFYGNTQEGQTLFVHSEDKFTTFAGGAIGFTYYMGGYPPGEGDRHGVTVCKDGNPVEQSWYSGKTLIKATSIPSREMLKYVCTNAYLQVYGE